MTCYSMIGNLNGSLYVQDELKNFVFHHFEEREYWPLKELNYHCRQPEVRLIHLFNPSHCTALCAGALTMAVCVGT
jgi:hypothetical protein